MEKQLNSSGQFSKAGAWPSCCNIPRMPNSFNLGNTTCRWGTTSFIGLATLGSYLVTGMVVDRSRLRRWTERVHACGAFRVAEPCSQVPRRVDGLRSEGLAPLADFSDIVSVFGALLGTTDDTCSHVSLWRLLEEFRIFLRESGFCVFVDRLRSTGMWIFWERSSGSVSAFSASRGSTADTYHVSLRRRLETSQIGS